jgi:predicted lysophospholipase L1 biosynthesis ABC-type transport system permease subunit
MVCGLHLALGPGKAGARSANRAGLAGVALASMTAVTALVLAASIDHLFSTPAAYGWTWDFVISNDAAADLADDPDVESVGLVTAAPISIDGRPVTARGVESLKGELPMLVVDGRQAGVGEVVLGGRTMAELDVSIGDTVVAQGSRTRQELRVVGEGVFAGIVDAPEAGWGAAVPRDVLEELGSEGDAVSGAPIALSDGADETAFATRYAAEWGESPASFDEPMELQRLREIEAFPRVLTAFLGTVGLVAAAHAILVTARLRRSDLAVLRAMGLPRRGVYEALSVQAGVLALLGAVVGIPLGLTAGQLVWRNLAGSLGVVVDVEVPWGTIVPVVMASCAAIATIALVPARAAVRIRPAVALRAE